MMPKNKQLAAMFAFSATRMPRIDCEIRSKSDSGMGGVFDSAIFKKANVEVTGAARLYRAAPVRTAGLPDFSFDFSNFTNCCFGGQHPAAAITFLAAASYATITPTSLADAP